jgi:hypothetical protein
LTGIAMINLDDVPNAAKELERAARLGFSGAMITEYPLERRRYAMKAFHPALSMCDLIFSGVFERHTRPTLAIVEFELAWAPHLLSTMDCTYRERHGEAIYRFKSLPSRRRGACPREGGGRHAAERLLLPQRRLELPGGRHRHSPARRHRP